MLDLLKLRIKHGFQAIDDLKKAAVPETHRGFPVINKMEDTDAVKIADVCPSGAISPDNFSLDLGRCTFCGECERASGGAIKFTSDFKLGTTSRDRLIVEPGDIYSGYRKRAIESDKEIIRIFGRSLKFRQVSAGGCNGCEAELNATGNVNFDLGRYGIDFVASPRHADGIVITGPITKNMAPALKNAYDSISDPKIVIAFGACAISGGIFAESKELNRSFLEEVKIDLFIPGCPPHPLVFINALLEFLNK